MFPKHKGELILTHNAHKSNYETVGQYIDNHVRMGNDITDDFASPEELVRAVESNELWHAQWYPDTPIGFLSVYASTLEALQEAWKEHL